MNYEWLLKMLCNDLGDNVIEIIVSSPIDIYPMFICLVFVKGHVEVVTVIKGSMSCNETLIRLMEVRDTFDRRIEVPDSANLRLTIVSNEGWSIPPSDITSLGRMSKEFNEVAEKFVGDVEQVISIDKIGNFLWLSQYIKHKNYIDAQFKDGESEQLLVFYCSPLVSEQILQSAFQDCFKSVPGRKYGHGFYFWKPFVHSNTYTSSNSLNSKQRIMLVCRVLVGRTCIGNWMIEKSPDGYDSTTNGSNIYVVYSNRSILPKYRIRYLEN